MKLLSVQDVIEHKSEESGITYRLGVPTVYDLARLKRRVRLAGARPVPREELARKLRHGVAAIAAAAGRPEEEARLAALLDEYDALRSRPRRPPTREDHLGKNARTGLDV